MYTTISVVVMLISLSILTGFFFHACSRQADPVSSIPLPQGYSYYSNSYQFCMCKKKFRKYRAYLMSTYHTGNLPVTRDFLNRPYIRTNSRNAFQAENYIDAITRLHF